GGVSRCTEELLVLLELPGMIRIALAVAASALNRRESRGCHIRTDYPHLDENFARRTLVRWDADNRKPVITYEPIT
ncbi:MAG: fumarate reductase flavoprotein subunit, partial [Spirochaetota bacterium]